MKPEITFIAERMPRTGSSGAESYNYYICQLLVKAGYQIKLIVTGDNFDTPCFLKKTYKNEEVFQNVHFIKYKTFLGVVISLSIKSYLRPLRKFLSKYLKKNNAKQRNLMMGRFISNQEASACLKYINHNAKFVFFDTIFRYHECFSAIQNEKVLVAHDVFSARTKSFNQQGFKVIPSIKADYETKVWNEFSLHIAINEDEKQLISESNKRLVCTVFPSYQNALNSTEKITKVKNKVLYIGANAHHNIHGLRYFLNKIWPTIFAKQPCTELLVVGSIADSFQNERMQGVHFLGRIDDLSVMANECKFAINPVYMGSGVKIKMLDYLSFNLPCLTTEVGMMGFIRQTTMPLVEAVDDSDFSEKILVWLTQSDVLKKVTDSIPRYVELFSSESASALLADSLTKVVES